MTRKRSPVRSNMRNWNFKAICLGCGFVLVLVIARLAVSLGRLWYTLYTGIDVIGGEYLPTWQELVFGDGFFYVGILALLGCVISAILAKKYQ